MIRAYVLQDIVMSFLDDTVFVNKTLCFDFQLGLFISLFIYITIFCIFIYVQSFFVFPFFFCNIYVSNLSLISSFRGSEVCVSSDFLQILTNFHHYVSFIFFC